MSLLPWGLDMDDWIDVPERDREAVRQWLEAHGVDPNHVTAIRLVTEGCLEVTSFAQRRNSGSGALEAYRDDRGEFVMVSAVAPVASIPPWMPR